WRHREQPGVLPGISCAVLMTLHQSSRQTSTLQGPVQILRIISEFSEVVGGTSDLPRLSDVLLTSLSQQTHLPKGGVWIREPDGDHYRLIASLRQEHRATLPLLLPGDHPLIHGLSDKPSMLHSDHAPTSPTGQ